MTETMGNPSGGTSPSDNAGTRDVAKDEARGVAQDAAEGGKQTAETAKQQAGEVAGEAANQAQMLIEQAREQLTTQGSEQKERATSGLRSLADEISGMVDGTSQPQGLAGDLARQASDQVRTAAEWLESRDPGDVLNDVRRFARRRPGMFLASAAAVGFLGGRLTRSATDEARDSGQSGPDQVGTGYAGTPGLTATGPTTGNAGFPDRPTGTPGYSVPPTPGETRGDPTAQFGTNTPPRAGGGTADQMPSEFGARGTGAAGNREEGR